MKLRAYAKINIGLRVLGKRPDGYHNIETVFHEIDLCDELAFENADTISMSSSSTGVPTDARNLCILAAEAVRERLRSRDGVKITLKKNIPVGAGLGGGSSDAAAVLIALNKLWNAGLDAKTLVSIGSTLGSDVPFFIRGGTALGSSRGEILEPFDLNVPFWIVTVTPPIHVSTAWAYARVKPRDRAKGENLRSAVVKGIAHPAQLPSTITNDFEKPVFAAHSEIRALKDALVKAGALFALMSGSGSSVFGFFQDKSAAHKAADAFTPPLVASVTQPDFKADHSVQ